MFIQAGFSSGSLWPGQPHVTQSCPAWDTAQNNPLCCCFGSGITRASLKLQWLSQDKITTLLELWFWGGGSLIWLMIKMKNVQLLPLLWQMQQRQWIPWDSGNIWSRVSPCSSSHCSWVSPGRHLPELHETPPSQKRSLIQKNANISFWRGSHMHDWFPHPQFLCHLPHYCSWWQQRGWVVTQGKWPHGPGGLADGHLKRTGTGMNWKDVNISLIDGSA